MIEPPLVPPGPAAPDQDQTHIRLRRLLFRATHRGTHENDLLLGGFVRDNLDRLTEDEIAALEAVMDLPDVDLADWLTGRQPIPPNAPPILPRIRASLAR
jgi:antitoxin CptB